MGNPGGMIQLSYGDLILAAAMVVVALGLSAWRGLRLERELGVASLRTVVQLVIIGYLLQYIFAANQWYWVVALILVMLLVAARETGARLARPPAYTLPIVTAALFFGTVLTLTYVTSTVVRVHPWYEPRYVIPLAGMILGNAMNAAAIAAERLCETLRDNVLEIETYLALGASPRQACERHIRAAVRAALIPTINAMVVVGIVKLPGIITGQMMAGAEPANAARYQILIMFMLAFVSVLCGVIVVEYMHRRFFTAYEQLDRAAISPDGGGAATGRGNRARAAGSRRG